MVQVITRKDIRKIVQVLLDVAEKDSHIVVLLRDYLAGVAIT